MSQHDTSSNSLESIRGSNGVKLNSQTVNSGSSYSSLASDQCSSLQSRPYNNAYWTSSSLHRQVENLAPCLPSVQDVSSQQNNSRYHQQQQLSVNCSSSQNILGNSQSNNITSGPRYTEQQKNNAQVQCKMYNTIQTGDTKITFRRMPVSDTAHMDKQPKHDLMQYWNVRKAGDCRLVFSANVGKRKAEEDTQSTAGYMSHSEEPRTLQPLSKRHKCLVY